MRHVDEDMDAWGLTHVERVRYLNRVWQYHRKLHMRDMVRVRRVLDRKWDVRLLWGCIIVGALLWLLTLVATLLG